MREEPSTTPVPLVGGLLRVLSEETRDHILRTVWAKGYDDITRAHLAVFQFPTPEGATPSTLAERAHISKQSMNYLLSELEQRGYLGRRDTAIDGRSRVVFLTPRGKRLVQAMRKSVKELEERWREMVGASRFDQTKSALMSIYSSTLDEDGPR
jgi:DNA-binding MarR family transcriptional regulator